MAAGRRAGASTFPVAGGMAFLAGATDVYGLARLHDLYVSFMSGNTTMLGVAIGGGDWGRAGSIAGLVGLFVAGAAVGAALAVAAGGWHAAAVALAVAAALAVPLVWPSWTVAAFVLAMGALNASMNHLGPTAISLTYVTGTLVKLGQGLGRALCGRPEGWAWLWQAPMWLCLLAGAASAVVLGRRLGADVLWPLPSLALVLSLGALAQGRE